MPDISPAALDAAQNAVIIAGTTYNLSLHTADPGDGTVAEGTDGRQPITFAASSGAVQASATAQTWTSPAGSQIYTNFGVWSADNTTYIRGGAFTTSFTPIAATPFTIVVGGITFMDS